jgi:RNA polymerase sigma factor (sigma-70 family)
MLYGVVRRALDGHCNVDDVDDVVQETLLRVMRGLRALRQPASFRTWLMSIAIRQIGTSRQRVADQGYVMEDANEVADPAAEFQNLAVLRLQLSEQHRQLVRAARWLDPDHRKLLRLWSQEVTGRIGRAELAAHVGISVAHAGVRLQRMHEQLRLCRVITAALAIRPACHQLPDAVEGRNRVTTSVWRKRIGRHIRDCEDCSGIAAELIPADRLLLACVTWLPLSHTAADCALPLATAHMLPHEATEYRWFPSSVGALRSGALT